MSPDRERESKGMCGLKMGIHWIATAFTVAASMLFEMIWFGTLLSSYPLFLFSSCLFTPLSFAFYLPSFCSVPQALQTWWRTSSRLWVASGPPCSSSTWRVHGTGDLPSRWRTGPLCRLPFSTNRSEKKYERWSHMAHSVEVVGQICLILKTQAFSKYYR